MNTSLKNLFFVKMSRPRKTLHGVLYVFYFTVGVVRVLLYSFPEGVFKWITIPN